MKEVRYLAMLALTSAIGLFGISLVVAGFTVPMWGKMLGWPSSMFGGVAAGLAVPGFISLLIGGISLSCWLIDGVSGFDKKPSKSNEQG